MKIKIDSRMIKNPFETIENRLDRIESLLVTSFQKLPDTQETLNLKQAAKLCQISGSRMYYLSRSKEIPSSRIGNRYVFIKGDLIQWLRSQSSKVA